MSIVANKTAARNILRLDNRPHVSTGGDSEPSACQTKTDAEILAELRAYRQQLGGVERDYASILEENERLRRAEAQRQAVQSGVAAHQWRRLAERPHSNPGRTFPEKSPDPSPVDSLAAVMLALTPGHRQWLLKWEHDAILRHLHAWQSVARQRVARTGDAGDLADVVDQHLPPAPDNGDSNYSLNGAVYTGLHAGLTRAGFPDAVTFLYWVMQHRACHAGRDKATVADLRAYLRDTFGVEWRDRYLRDVLRKGRTAAAVLWRNDERDPHDARQVLYAVVAKEKLMLTLGIEDPGMKVFIPDHAWKAGPKTWQAFCWAAFVDTHHGNGWLARETLAVQFGISRRTTYDYDQAASLDVTQTVGAAPKPRTEAEQLELDERKRPFSWTVVHQWWNSGRHYLQPYTAWQDVNRYKSKSTRKAGSHRRKHLMAATQALRADLSEIPRAGQGGDAPLQADEAPTLTVTHRFMDERRAELFQEQHPGKPVLVFWKRPPPRVRVHGATHAWQYAYSVSIKKR